MTTSHTKYGSAYARESNEYFMKYNMESPKSDTFDVEDDVEADH
jgi:hypothetical protein